MPRGLSHASPTKMSVINALLLVLAAVVIAAALAVPSADAKRAANKPVAKVTLSQVKVAAQKVTIAGRVTLPVNTARERKRTRVAFTLKDAKRKTERFTVAIDAKRAFKLTRATKLTGKLSLSSQVTIGGKASGKALSRTITVTVVTRRTTTPGGGGTTTPGGGGTTTPGGGGTTTPPVPVPEGATPLVGTFKLDEGRQAVSGRLSGTYFRMLGVSNGDSTALDKNYTLLRPGSDGGLRTDAFQEPPVPAFATTDPVSGLPSGNALASRIVLPQKFFSTDFSIVTAATDPQAGVADALPQIVNDGGTLSGQITAWNAQWNGLSFNQGAPKPDGSTGGGTKRPTGTYDVATQRFVLTWSSLIRGGPFNNFVGEWHLEGIFQPTA